MSETPDHKPEDEEEPTERRRRRGGRIGLWMIVFPLVLFLIGGIGYLSLSGRPLDLPAFVADRIEAELGRRTGGEVEIGDVVLQVAENGLPHVIMRDLEFSGADGSRLGQINAVVARLEPGALMDLKLAAHSLEVAGAQITLRRAADGSFSLGLGGGGEQALDDFGEALSRVDTMLSDNALSSVGSIVAQDLTIALEDVRSGRVWNVTDGRIDVKNDPQATDITIRAEVFNGTEDLAGVQLSFVASKESRQTSISAQVENAHARDIALQAPALAFLSSLDALVSGSVRAVVTEEGVVERLDAALDLGEGALRPTEQARPVRFNQARAYMSYDPAREKITFQELFAEGDGLRLSGAGHAYLRDFNGRWPETLLAQVALDEIAAAPEGMFDDAVTFSKGIADLRLRLEPFSVEFGQVVFEAEDQRVFGKGRVAVTEGGWSGAVDVSAAELTPARLVALWPVTLAPKTRRWFSQNLLAGQISGIEAALRLVAQAEPRVGLTFDFDAGNVRFLPRMPPIEGGVGHAAIIDGGFSISLAEGVVRDEFGQAAELSGSTFQILDVFEQPGEALLRLKVLAPLATVLRIMNNRPFEVLENSGLPPDLALATARLEGRVAFPLGRDLTHDDVAFRITGGLEDVRSESLVAGRVLTSRRLEVDIQPDLLRLSGPAALDGLAVDAVFRQPIGPDSTGAKGEVSGEVALSRDFLETFGIALPPEILRGAGTGAFRLTLAKAEPPEFSLTSDLAGLEVSIPALSWTKPASESGTFEIAGRLGETPEIDRLRLAGAGLDTEGQLSLADGGSIQSLDLPRLTVGEWFDAPVRLSWGGEATSPRIEVLDGTVDLRRMPESRGGESGGAVTVALDALVVTDNIALTSFRGDIATGNGLNGRFQARVNGGAPISGVLVPQRGRTAVRIQGDNAGQILRDARVFRSLDNGSFDLILAPDNSANGFDGQIEIRNAVLGDQSVLVDLLDAVSVVGLLDQVRGAGVLFDLVQGRFKLTPDRLTLNSGSAVGASLGVSLDGVYDIGARQLEMQGVLSPVYLLNSVGQVFTRRGEGLFGFTFTLRGDADRPRIAVNPLSILTPGMFREIFRRPPPEQ